MVTWSFPRAASPGPDPRCAGKRLLLVGTCEVKRRHTLERLRALGLARIICLHPQTNWAAPWVDDWIFADPAGVKPAALDATRDFLAAHPGYRIDGVLTFDEYNVQMVARLAELLGVPGIAPAVADLGRDKLAFRQFCAASGLPTPGHALLVGTAGGCSPDAALAGARGLKFPLVVKPTTGGGSTFVRKVADVDELRAAIETFQREVPLSSLAKLWTNNALYAEEYLAGDEVDLDVLVQGGEVRFCGITDNFAPLEPYFMERGGRCPSSLPPDQQAALQALARAVVQGLGVRDGCLHLEARVTAEGPVPIEANMRLGGAEVYAFNRAAWGVDMIAEVTAIALGAPVQVPPVGATPLAWLQSVNLLPPRTGYVAELGIPPTLKADPTLVELAIFRGIGDYVPVPPEGYQYLGWLVATGANAAEAARHAEALTRSIRIAISDEPLVPVHAVAAGPA